MAGSAGSIFVDLLLRDGQYNQGLNRASRSTSNWSNKTKKDFGGLTSALNTITASVTRFATVAGTAFALVTLIRAADRVTALEGRIKLATQSTEEFNQAFQGLADQSIKFGSNLEAGVSVFQRLSFVRKEIEATVDEMLQFTSTVQQLSIISGASTASLTAGLTQLGHSL